MQKSNNQNNNQQQLESTIKFLREELSIVRAERGAAQLRIVDLECELGESELRVDILRNQIENIEESERMDDLQDHLSDIISEQNRKLISENQRLEAARQAAWARAHEAERELSELRCSISLARVDREHAANLKSEFGDEADGAAFRESMQLELQKMEEELAELYSDGYKFKPRRGRMGELHMILSQNYERIYIGVPIPREMNLWRWISTQQKGTQAQRDSDARWFKRYWREVAKVVELKQQIRDIKFLLLLY